MNATSPNPDQLAELMETVAAKESTRGLIGGLLLAGVAFSVYKLAQSASAPAERPQEGQYPYNHSGGGHRSTLPDSRQHDPYSGHLPGYGPGDPAGSYI